MSDGTRMSAASSEMRDDLGVQKRSFPRLGSESHKFNSAPALLKPMQTMYTLCITTEVFDQTIQHRFQMVVDGVLKSFSWGEKAADTDAPLGDFNAISIPAATDQPLKRLLPFLVGDFVLSVEQKYNISLSTELVERMNDALWTVSMVQASDLPSGATLRQSRSCLQKPAVIPPYQGPLSNSFLFEKGKRRGKRSKKRSKKASKKTPEPPPPATVGHPYFLNIGQSPAGILPDDDAIF
jgi:hypothetical protein